jgi:hypothetical protein
MSMRRNRDQLYADYAKTLAGHFDQRYQMGRASRVLKITTVRRDSVNKVYEVEGEIDQVDGFKVPTDRELNVGDVILVDYPKDETVASELRFVQLLNSDYVTTGLLKRVEALNFPAPTFRVPPATSEVIISPGSTTTRVTVHFTAVEQKYDPSYYKVTYKLTSAPSWSNSWSDTIRHDPNDPELDLILSYSFPPQTSIDIRLSTFYAYGDREVQTDPSSAITYVTAANTTSPGAATGLMISENVMGGLVIEVVGTKVPGVFDGWIIQASYSPGGPAIYTSPVIDGVLLYPGTPGQQHFFSAWPVSIAGVVGGRYPTVGFYPLTGPGYIPPAPAILDTTPPPTPDAPIVEGIVRVSSDYIGRPSIRIKPPINYQKPPDFAGWVFTLVNQDTGRPTVYVAPDTARTAFSLGTAILSESGYSILTEDGDYVAQEA